MPGLKPMLIFLEARDATLVRRFSETRRPHPLAKHRPVLDGIHEERRSLKAIRAMADEIIDTSDLTVYDLRDAFMAVARGRARARPLQITLVSFGFKHGIPVESDLVFDVRFLPNPHFFPRLRPLSGRDRAVMAFMRRHPATQRDHRPPRGPAAFSDSAVRGRRQDLPDRRDRVHRRAASVGLRGRAAPAGARVHRPACSCTSGIATWRREAKPAPEGDGEGVRT